jgi:hypothetical protein
MDRAQDLVKSSSDFQFSPFVRAIVSELQRDGQVVGEERNLGAAFFALLTKDLRRRQRLHIVMLSLSGSGKSTLAEAVLRPFKDCSEKKCFGSLQNNAFGVRSLP